MSKRTPDKPYQRDGITRRELLTRVGGAAAITAGGAYVSLAPPTWPLSLRDPKGLIGLPEPSVFQLPSFAVTKPMGAGDVGIGRGGTVIERMTKALDAVGGLTHFINPGDVVLVKPNVAFDRSPNLGATTNPELIETLIRMLLVDARAAEVRIADNPIESPADCFAKSGIRAASERGGAQVYLPDSNAFEDLATPGATLIAQWPFFKRPFRNVNKVIGIAPVKDHNLCHASLGIKNWYGLLGGRRNQFHQDIHEIIADLSIMIRPTLSILDGTHVLMENGPTGGDPSNVKNADVIMAATDPVAMDAWAFQHLLERTSALPDYLYRAEARGSGKVDYHGRIKEVV
ncbi:MAG: DUF362 domain-containing protein [Pseudomonadota bacterium]